MVRHRDPVVAATALVLWLLLAFFVVYPLAMLFARMLTDHGTFTTAGLAKILTDRHQIRAFWNSLLLATLVGILGTVVGFLFAFTAARGRLPRWLLAIVDASVLLPLVRKKNVEYSITNSSRKKLMSSRAAPVMKPTASVPITLPTSPSFERICSR